MDGHVEITPVEAAAQKVNGYIQALIKAIDLTLISTEKDHLFSLPLYRSCLT